MVLGVRVGVPNAGLSKVGFRRATRRNRGAESIAVGNNRNGQIPVLVVHLWKLIVRGTECKLERVQRAIATKRFRELDPDAIAAPIAVPVINEGGLDLRHRRFCNVDFSPPDALVLCRRS